MQYRLRKKAMNNYWTVEYEVKRLGRKVWKALTAVDYRSDGHTTFVRQFYTQDNATLAAHVDARERAAKRAPDTIIDLGDL